MSAVVDQAVVDQAVALAGLAGSAVTAEVEPEAALEAEAEPELEPLLVGPGLQEPPELAPVSQVGAPERQRQGSAAARVSVVLAGSVRA